MKPVMKHDAKIYTSLLFPHEIPMFSQSKHLKASLSHYANGVVPKKKLLISSGE